MARVFISYSRTDERFARQLAQALSGLGADIWIDIEDIPVGEKWSRAIQQGLDKGDVMLVIISPDSMGSSNVEDEWQYYLDQKKPVIPILYQPAKIHFQLNRIQYIDFHNHSFEAGLRKLHTELAVQGIQLQPLPAAATLQGMPAMRLPKRWFDFQPLVLGMGAAMILVVVIGLAAVLMLNNGGDETTVTDDPVQNAKKLLEAMSERNFGIADELVCDAVDVREDGTWGQPLEDIFCHEGSSSNEVGCSFNLDGQEFVVTLVVDDDNRICGQT